MTGARRQSSGVRRGPRLPEFLRKRVRRHHNRRGDYLIKGDVAYQRLARFARKYGLRLVP